MNNTGFEASHWDHWLLILCFVSVASYGLWLSWQWRSERRQKWLRQRMAQRLRVELLDANNRRQQVSAFAARHEDRSRGKTRKAKMRPPTSSPQRRNTEL